MLGLHRFAGSNLSKCGFTAVFHLYEGIDGGKAEKSEHFEFAEFLLRTFVNKCNST